MLRRFSRLAGLPPDDECFVDGGNAPEVIPAREASKRRTRQKSLHRQSSNSPAGGKHAASLFKTASSPQLQKAPVHSPSRVSRSLGPTNRASHSGYPGAVQRNSSASSSKHRTEAAVSHNASLRPSSQRSQRAKKRASSAGVLGTRSVAVKASCKPQLVQSPMRWRSSHPEARITRPKSAPPARSQFSNASSPPRQPLAERDPNILVPRQPRCVKMTRRRRNASTSSLGGSTQLRKENCTIQTSWIPTERRLGFGLDVTPEKQSPPLQRRTDAASLRKASAGIDAIRSPVKGLGRRGGNGSQGRLARGRQEACNQKDILAATRAADKAAASAMEATATAHAVTAELVAMRNSEVVAHSAFDPPPRRPWSQEPVICSSNTAADTAGWCRSKQRLETEIGSRAIGSGYGYPEEQLADLANIPLLSVSRDGRGEQKYRPDVLQEVDGDLGGDLTDSMGDPMKDLELQLEWWRKQKDILLSGRSSQETVRKVDDSAEHIRDNYRTGASQIFAQARGEHNCMPLAARNIGSLSASLTNLGMHASTERYTEPSVPLKFEPPSRAPLRDLSLQV